MSRLGLILVCVMALSAVAMHAQATDPSASPSPVAPPIIDPSKLGISFDRIRMQLAEPAPLKGSGLKIEETISVVGKAPPILLWDPRTVKANLTSAAVPFGGPTQKDIMKLIVPKEFQNSPMDLNALMQWLMEHLNKRSE